MRYFRKVIRITAEDSPNVIYAKQEIKKGLNPSNKIVIPGVLPYEDYLKRRLTWDPIRQSIGLDALFYKGSEVLLYPQMWLDLAEQRARDIAKSAVKRQARSMGIDSGQGSANTSVTIIDELGIIIQVNERTPNTDAIPKAVKRLGALYGIPAQYWMFDAGGGGVQHADRLRAEGYPVPPAVGFGESVQPKKNTKKTPSEKKSDKEQRYQFANRRAEMYWLFREALDPSLGGTFAIPSEYVDLRKQLSLMPLLYDGEGRICMLPKYRRGTSSTQTKQPTLTELIGKSPDEADSTVLALYGLKRNTGRNKARSIKGKYKVRRLR